MKIRIWTLVLLLPSLRAFADGGDLDGIVRRARAVADQKLGPINCKMSIDTRVYDKSGRLEHTELRDGDVKLDGDDTDFHTTRAVRDGKAMSADELAAEAARQKKQRAEKKKDSDEDMDLEPLKSKNADGERFELVRKEQLWGHDAGVLKVSATKEGASLANGLLWIDAASFVLLKGELEPVKLPPHADWLKVQEQFTPARGGAVPTLLRITGAGHLLMFKKSFATTMKWSGCS